MKFLTETRDEGRIVEMSGNEVKLFRRLVMAVEGEEMNATYYAGQADEWRSFYASDHVDMSKTFNVIAEWILQKCRLNELEHALRDVRSAIEGDHA